MSRRSQAVPMRESCVAVGRWRLKMLEIGAGPPIVLVHGLGTSLWSWQRNLEALAACGRVLAVDLPGFGDSQTPDHVLDAEALADVLADWCAEMGLARARFIGHSLGGEVCLWLAAKYPALVEQLVLAGSTGAPRSLHLAQRLLRLAWDGLREPTWFLPVLLRAYWQAGPRRILRTAHISDPHRLAPRLADVAAETLVLWGANDPVIPLAEARQLAKRLPRGRLVVVADGAHGLIFDAPSAFNREVCAFMASAHVDQVASLTPSHLHPGSPPPGWFIQ